MNFRVVWPRQAIERLARAYLAADAGRAAETVTSAMVLVEQQLQGSPSTAGESRAEGERLLIVPPIVVAFEVFTDERVVVVTDVRYRPMTS